MTKQEVIKFLEKIKANYQSFNIEEEYVVQEWYNTLKEYDREDVYKKLEEHLKGDYSSNTPKMSYITKFLTKSADKGKEKKYKVICSYCQKKIFLSDYEKHIERHNSIEYMKLHNKIDEEAMMRLSDDTFNKGYRNWIENRCDKLIDKKEKTLEEKKELSRLEKYIMSNPGEQLNLDM